MKLLHKKRAAKAAYYGIRWRLRKLLRLPEKPNLNVVQGDFSQALERHRRICLTLLPYLKSIPSLRGGVAAEIGSGDCLSAADMVLGMGARHVHLLDQRAIVVSSEHKTIAQALSADSHLPNSGHILMRENPTRLDPMKATTHTGLLESATLPEPVDLIYSFDVLEHVEDLHGFFLRCREISQRGAIHVHKFDLSGHEFFEDPVPPLDFQTYPDWLFDLIFPKYRRAVGHLADEIFEAMKANGCIIKTTDALRLADPDYLKAIRPTLRAKARQRDDATLALLDVVVVAQQT
jgi:hypothetical protein